MNAPVLTIADVMMLDVKEVIALNDMTSGRLIDRVVAYLQRARFDIHKISVVLRSETDEDTIGNLNETQRVLVRECETIESLLDEMKYKGHNKTGPHRVSRRFIDERYSKCLEKMKSTQPQQ